MGGRIRTTDEMLRVLRKSGSSGMTRRQLRQTFAAHLAWIEQSLLLLHARGRARMVRRKRGRGGTVWVAVRR
jgi:hypothetical protein